ncbi:hypothetical protein (partial), partial [Candidatus Ichthyocystis hellenicum]
NFFSREIEQQADAAQFTSRANKNKGKAESAASSSNTRHGPNRGNLAGIRPEAHSSNQTTTGGGIPKHEPKTTNPRAEINYNLNRSPMESNFGKRADIDNSDTLSISSSSTISDTDTFDTTSSGRSDTDDSIDTATNSNKRGEKLKRGRRLNPEQKKNFMARRSVITSSSSTKSSGLSESKGVGKDREENMGNSDVNERSPANRGAHYIPEDADSSDNDGLSSNKTATTLRRDRRLNPKNKKNVTTRSNTNTSSSSYPSSDLSASEARRSSNTSSSSYSSSDFSAPESSGKSKSRKVMNDSEKLSSNIVSANSIISSIEKNSVKIEKDLSLLESNMEKLSFMAEEVSKFYIDTVRELEGKLPGAGRAFVELKLATEEHQSMTSGDFEESVSNTMTDSRIISDNIRSDKEKMDDLSMKLKRSSSPQESDDILNQINLLKSSIDEEIKSFESKLLPFMEEVKNSLYDLTEKTYSARGNFMELAFRSLELPEINEKNVGGFVGTKEERWERMKNALSAWKDNDFPKITTNVDLKINALMVDISYAEAAFLPILKMVRKSSN